ncbi:MAG: alanine racemase [Bacteroidetes bacterium]|nr:MAG: alanine racemase [Bacteroidota bacterium]
MVALGRPWPLEELAQITGGQLLGPNQVVRYLAWDTRALQGGENVLFVALRAARDGHTYLEEAFARGAVASLCEKPLPGPHTQLVVPDTWQALWKWATAWRKTLSYPLLAITGAIGKTWVKEWLAYLLEGDLITVRSPGSFNSRLGVPVSILSFPREAEVGLVEVGFTEPGEITLHAEMVAPTWGLLTADSSRHLEAFPDKETRAREAFQLFATAEWIVAPQEPAYLTTAPQSRMRWVGETGDFRWQAQAPYEGLWRLPDGRWLPVRLPEKSPFAWQNALLAAAAAYQIGVPAEHLQARLATLPPLPHRLQWIYDAEGRLWIDDTYHADKESVLAALQEIAPLQALHPVVILSDFAPYTSAAHEEVVAFLRAHFPPEKVHLIGPLFSQTGWGNRYPDRETFLREARLAGRVFFVKGSRRHALETVLPHLMGQGLAPELRIDWEKVYRNLAYLRSHLPPGTRILAMLKAEAYGGGDLGMAHFLVRQGVDYLGVAYAREALRLREAGLTVPIVVFYPGQEPIALYQTAELEVAVGTWEALAYWAGQVPLHVEFDTGMGRMGFLPEELPSVIRFLQEKKAQVRGLFSHLAQAEAPCHPATQQQKQRFAALYEAFKQAFPEALGHLLNTAGVLSLGKEAAYDMVRIGIGLYGALPPLEEATSLYAPILRVREYTEGQLLNYGFSAQLPRTGKVATVAIGYGDGLLRGGAHSNSHFFWQGQKLPILPPLNMDLTLVFAGDLPLSPGEPVEVWGPTRPLRAFAEAWNTTPYEALVRLSRRVRRIYSWGAL